MGDRIGECAYCGARGIITSDHVPPKGIFSKPRPNDLITVPACRRCHSKTSMDDEYFRNVLFMRDDLGGHPDVERGRATVTRSLENPCKIGMLRGLFKDIFLADVVTPGGIFIKKQWALRTDMVRVRGVVSRTMKGLFYHHKRYRLPEGYEARVCADDDFKKWPAREKSLIDPILARKPLTIGNGVFSYGFGSVTADPNWTIWVFAFYERAAFVGMTLPPEEASASAGS
jgi:hypothetical protein